MHDDKTTRGYKLPHRDNELSVDVDRLRETINSIDTDIDALNKATPDGATTASPGIVKLASDDDVSTATGDGVITAKQSGLIKPKTATVPEGGFTDGTPPNFADTESLVSPAFLHNVFLWLNKGKAPDIIGVVDNGVRNASGMGLSWIDGDFNIIDELAPDYFDKHPSYQFDDVRLGSNYFRRIPICYTRRGFVPSGKPNAGKWFQQLCSEQVDGFEPHYTAFMYKGVLKDSFLWATHRAFNDGNKPGSQPGKPHWQGVSWDAFTAAAASLGDGYHMGSFQEYHEILMRAVIERKTFDLWPIADRRNYQKNHYRGIEEMAYDRYSDDSTNGTYAEWRSGVRTGADKQLEVWNTDGKQNYVKSGKTPNINGYIGSLLTGTHFDHMFFAETTAPSIEQSMIPDYNYTAGASCVGYSRFVTGSGYGAFYSSLSYSASYAGGGIGSRVAKI